MIHTISRAQRPAYPSDSMQSSASKLRSQGCLSKKTLCKQPPPRVPLSRCSIIRTAVAERTATGHSALLHALGDIGDVPAGYVPSILRLAHARSKLEGGDSAKALQEAARGIMIWRSALDRGLLPDDDVIRQISTQEAFASGRTLSELRWPQEPLVTDK
jgi:hypothetical protein